jgi:hypothetical protein
MGPSKVSSATADSRRMTTKVVPLADDLDTLQQQLKILRRREKLLKGTGPLIAR